MKGRGAFTVTAQTGVEEVRSNLFEAGAPALDLLLNLPLAQIVPSPKNPRKRFEEADLLELGASLKVRQVQPIAVRPLAAADVPPELYAPEIQTYYELVCGERRLRAAALVGKATILAFVADVDDIGAAEMRLAENEKRKDITAMERARAFHELKELYEAEGVKEPVLEIAGRVGTSRSSVYASLQLLELHDECINLLERGWITESHARLLAPLGHADQLAHLNRAVYEQVWDGPNSCYRRGDGRRNSGTMSVRELKSQIESDKWDLQRAPFALDDRGLPGIGENCILCPKRSANTPGFEKGDKEELCGDKECFKEKLVAYARAREVELRTMHPGLKLLSLVNAQYCAPGHLARGEWCVSAREDALPGMIDQVSGPHEIPRVGELMMFEGRRAIGGQGAMVLDGAQGAPAGDRVPLQKLADFAESDKKQREEAAQAAEKARLERRDYEPRRALERDLRTRLLAAIGDQPAHKFPAWNEDLARWILFVGLGDFFDEDDLREVFGWGDEDVEAIHEAVEGPEIEGTVVYQMRLGDLIKAFRIAHACRDRRQTQVLPSGFPAGLFDLAIDVGISPQDVLSGVQTSGSADLSDEEKACRGRQVALEAKRLERDELASSARNLPPSKELTKATQQIKELDAQVAEMEAALE